MGGAKRQLEEYEEFLVNRPPVHMNTDTLAYILTLASEATQLELTRTRKELEELKKRERERSFTIEEKLRINEMIDQSFERIYRVVSTNLN